MGKKGKKAAPPTQEEIDIQELYIRSQHANAIADELKARAVAYDVEHAGYIKARKEQAEEVDELYTYLDTQMLHSARERYDFERKYRDECKARKEEVAAMQAQLDEQRARSDEKITQLQEELAATQAELEALVEFRGVRPQMEAEMSALRKQLEDEREKRRREEHEQQVNFWRERQAMHEQMLERIRQAKTNFLDITAEMLDSTVHRTIVENQHLLDELAVQSSQARAARASDPAALAGRRPRSTFAVCPRTPSRASPARQCPSPALPLSPSVLSPAHARARSPCHCAPCP